MHSLSPLWLTETTKKGESSSRAYTGEEKDFEKFPVPFSPPSALHWTGLELKNLQLSYREIGERHLRALPPPSFPRGGGTHNLSRCFVAPPDASFFFSPRARTPASLPLPLPGRCASSKEHCTNLSFSQGEFATKTSSFPESSFPRARLSRLRFLFLYEEEYSRLLLSRGRVPFLTREPASPALFFFFFFSRDAALFPWVAMRNNTARPLTRLSISAA